MDSISIDSNEITCTCCNTIDNNRLGNLFRRKPDVSRRLKGDDILCNIKLLYGVTVNILPFKQMNKKRWYTYSHDKQREILARIEAKFRKDTPSCELVEIQYEIAPSEDEFHNIHFHALYLMPEIYKAELETYYQRIISCNTNKNWRHLDIRLINDIKQWLTYIRKDIKIV
jgi:hypothetical protein